MSSKVLRVAVVIGACAAAAGSAQQSQQNPQVSPSYYNTNANYNPPPAQQMEAARALGLWRSTFGAVKIEADNNVGGIDAGALQGIWVYQRQGQEVVGYFSGQLKGNVLTFKWQEPSNPPLTGEGYLVFDREGRQYSGRWWSDRRDRVGVWNGWRGAPANTGEPAPAYNEDRSPAPDNGRDPYDPRQPAPATPPTKYY